MVLMALAAELLIGPIPATDAAVVAGMAFMALMLSTSDMSFVAGVAIVFFLAHSIISLL